MSEEQKSGKSQNPFGVRPVFLIAAGIALLGFGVISGVGLDLATRPAPRPVAKTPAGPPKPSRGYVAPKFETPDERAAPATNSILDAPPPQPATATPPPVTPSVVKAPAVVTTAVPDNALAANTVPSTADARQPVVAIVIDDMGLDHTHSVKMIQLPGPLTLSLMTYADGLPALVEQGHKAGHEILAHLPMEPINAKENPGPGALRANMDEAAIRRTLAQDLDGWSGYVGVNNHMGSKFTKDKVRMGVVMSELKARGLLWLDSKTIGDTVGPVTAKAAGVPYVERDVFLDNTETVEAVTTQLELLAAAAKKNGSAIAIGHPHDATFAALQKWLPTLQARGIDLVPVTEVLKRRSAP